MLTAQLLDTVTGGVRCVPDVLHLSFCAGKVFVSHSSYLSNKNFCELQKSNREKCQNLPQVTLPLMVTRNLTSVSPTYWDL